ncbi:MAG TPA: hypothetical protein VE890_03440, partial [Thermoguttaceae bacterium]|nr:hypothetical protein [Thermoguttaceae bacterium]
DAPGGGGRTLRRQLAVLKKFIHSFDFLKMSPDNSVIHGKMPAETTARALVEPGRQYAVYIKGDGVKQLALELPGGSYQAQWVNTKTGAVDREETFHHTDGTKTLQLPGYTEDIALSIRSGR